MSDYTDTSYDTGYDVSYDTSYATTTYTEPTYDTSWSAEAPAVDPSWTQVDSYSYDSTDWGYVAEVSQDHMVDYNMADDAGWALYNASTELWLEGDTMGAYELNTMSIEAFSIADDSWDASNQVWSTMDQTTTVTTWDTGSSYDTSSYDTSSYDTSSYDTSSDW